MGWINIVNETMDGIDYDMECPNCHTRQIEEDSAADLVRERDEFEAQLTQRTAELEAANKHCEIIEERKAEAYKEVEIQLLAKADLQAELERVRALTKALPKVEGEVTVRDVTALYWTSDGTYGSIDCKEQLVSLLKHRQGMEG